jgi:hypothetical protein
MNLYHFDITHWKLSLEMYPPLEKAQNQIIMTAPAPTKRPVPLLTGAGAAFPIVHTILEEQKRGLVPGRVSIA